MFFNYFDVGYQLVLVMLLFNVVIPWIAMIHAPAKTPLRVVGFVALAHTAWLFVGQFFMYRFPSVASLMSIATHVVFWGALAVTVGMIVLRVKDEATARETH